MQRPAERAIVREAAARVEKRARDARIARLAPASALRRRYEALVEKYGK
jgi:hypothetical protein